MESSSCEMGKAQRPSSIQRGPGRSPSRTGWEEAGPPGGPWGGITSLAKLLTRVFGQEVSQSFGELGPKLPGLGCWVGVVLLPYLVLTG